MTVAEHGNLTRAAAALHLAQPSLSTQLKRLERDLGTQLFERVPRGVALTPAGAALLPIARQALADVEQIRRTANELTSPDGGTLRVGATPSLSSVLLPAALTAFHTQHQRVALEFVEAGSEDLIERLERDELDLALVILPVPHRAVQTVPLAEEDLMVVVGPGHPLASRSRIGITELDGVPLVVPRAGLHDPDHDLRRVPTRGLRAGRRLRRRRAVGRDRARRPRARRGGDSEHRRHPSAGPARDPDRSPAAGPHDRTRAPHGGGRTGVGATFAAELFALLHEAGWPGVRPSGLRLASGTTISPWPAPARRAAPSVEPDVRFQ